ncbi:hypothetical protein B4135_2084 [Caldibacillus debilis]|uniref:Uncharacterized protein n=1 Tax=Caldibacillus debilis TaxID=301148 RepID=A0A150M4A6_9BACI|nr:hypothetical protein B4135_2084 [Caldibacillus debilis]
MIKPKTLPFPHFCDRRRILNVKRVCEILNILEKIAEGRSFLLARF